MKNKKAKMFVKLMGIARKYRTGLLALAAGIIVPTAIVAAQSAYSVPSSGTTINCLVAGSCSIVVTEGSALVSAAPSDKKFGSGVESASFTGLSLTSVTSTNFLGSTTTTFRNDSNTSLILSASATTGTQHFETLRTCMSVATPTGTAWYITWPGGVATQSLTPCSN